MLKFLALLLPLVLSSCATCREDAHRNDLACWAKDKVVDCTTNAVVPEVLPLLLQLVQAVTSPDGSVNWASVETTVVQMGVRDGGCLLAALQQKLSGLSTSASTPAMRRAASEARTSAEATQRARWPGLTFRLAGGTP